MIKEPLTDIMTRFATEAYNSQEHSEMYEQPIQRSRDARLLASTFIILLGKLQDSCPEYEKLLNDKNFQAHIDSYQEGWLDCLEFIKHTLTFMDIK